MSGSESEPTTKIRYDPEDQELNKKIEKDGFPPALLKLPTLDKISILAQVSQLIRSNDTLVKLAQKSNTSELVEYLIKFNKTTHKQLQQTHKKMKISSAKNTSTDRVIATKNQELMPNILQHMNRVNRRSRRQIFGAIANYIQQSTRPFSKSQLIDIDINPETAVNYIKCFEIGQNTPKIIILRTGTRTSIGKKSYPKASSNKIRYKTPRSMVEIFQDVSNYIINTSKSFHKSDLSEIGLDTKTAGIYIDCFEIVQNTPRILVHRPGKSVIVGRSPGLMED